ncbi:MAG: hypothetical protein HQK53_03330, partial [Oligoflexia bacterium]|nr:hypothetical protein [Oligoflexia bacterium]
TNDESRLTKGLDSKGCVVLSNNNLKDLSRYIELGKTSVVIVQDLYFLRKETWESNRSLINQAFQSWLTAWKNKDIDRYLNFYHPDFQDSQKGDLKHFKRYKASIFQMQGTPLIEASEISILAFENYATLLFKQRYKSHTIDDVGKKILYLKKDERYQWRIVSELWSKLDGPPGVGGRKVVDGSDLGLASASTHRPFSPSMRFFLDSNSSSGEGVNASNATNASSASGGGISL